MSDPLDLPCRAVREASVICWPCNMAGYATAARGRPASTRKRDASPRLSAACASARAACDLVRGKRLPAFGWPHGRQLRASRVLHVKRERKFFASHAAVQSSFLARALAPSKNLKSKNRARNELGLWRLRAWRSQWPAGAVTKRPKTGNTGTWADLGKKSPKGKRHR